MEGDPEPSRPRGHSSLGVSLQERRFLRMLAGAGVLELRRHEIPGELLQPLVPCYEMALAQLEKTVRVRSLQGLGAGPGPPARTGCAP